MNEQIQKAIDKFTHDYGDIDAVFKSELLSLLKLVAEDAYHKIPGMTTKDFEDYWKTLTEQL